MNAQYNSADELIEKIISHARSWLDTPFLHQGRSRAGCDCIGVMIDIARVILNMQFTDRSNYGRLPDGSQLYAAFKEHMIEIDKDAYGPGDVLLMTWGRDPHHCALVTRMQDGNLGIIHSHAGIRLGMRRPAAASTPPGKLVEHILDERWRARITHAFAFPAVQALRRREVP